jgi:hypothetical protein
MNHSIGYLGYRSLNEQHGGRCGFQVRPDGRLEKLDPKPKKVDGIWFGYMELDETGLQPTSPQRYVVTRVEYMEIDVCVTVPVKLDERHMDGKKVGFSPPYFGDESARRLLTDLIAANPDQAKALGTVLARLGG